MCKCSPLKFRNEYVQGTGHATVPADGDYVLTFTANMVSSNSQAIWCALYKQSPGDQGWQVLGMVNNYQVRQHHYRLYFAVTVDCRATRGRRMTATPAPSPCWPASSRGTRCGWSGAATGSPSFTAIHTN